MTSRQRSNAQVTDILSPGTALRCWVPPNPNRPTYRFHDRSPDLPAREWNHKRFLARVRKIMATGMVWDRRAIPWDLSAGSKLPCLKPRHVATVRGWDFTSNRDGKARFVGLMPVFARCRECENCVKHRAKVWIARTIQEADATPGRIWFATLTSNEAHRAFIDAAGGAERARHGKKYLDATPQQLFHFKAIAMKREIAAWLKRVRAGYGRNGATKFRFVAVIEPHADGQPHAHVVLLEHGSPPLSERLLRSRWQPRGFAQCKLAEDRRRVAAYISPYITKNGDALIWASKFFGQPPQR